MPMKKSCSIALKLIALMRITSSTAGNDVPLKLFYYYSSVHTRDQLHFIHIVYARKANVVTHVDIICVRMFG